MRLIGLLLVFLLSLGGAPAGALEPPTGATILTVVGDVRVENGNGAALFDRQMLEALDWRTVRTQTPFTEGVQEFSGPTLVSLLETLGVKHGTLRARAVNDYSADIPVVHAAQHDVLLAMEHNGRPMRVRDKGPIWVIYPLEETETPSQSFDRQMIWQLVHIEVID